MPKRIERDTRRDNETAEHHWSMCLLTMFSVFVVLAVKHRCVWPNVRLSGVVEGAL